MSIVLTDEQRLQIDTGRMTEVVDPHTGRRFTLVPSEEYEAIKDLADREAWARMSVRTLGRRLADGE